MRHFTTMIAITLIIALGNASTARAQADEAARIKEATTVLEEILNAPDVSVPEWVAQKVQGIAVFPSVKKAGLLVGGQWGRGVLSAKSTKSGTWSAPAFLTLTGGSIGAQIGAQAVDVVLVVMSRRGLTNLVSNEFKVGADAGVAAGPVGREATVGTDVTMRAEILSYSRARGLFAGINLNGSSIRGDDDANQRFYGRPLKTADIIFKPMTAPPAGVPDWQAMLGRFAK